MSNQSNQVSLLNKLITTLYDGENGYKEAAEEVSNTALKTRFLNLSQQRYDFGHDIKPFIKSLGGEVDKGGSVAASLHRVWMDLKTAVSSQDEESILNEIIRGEESAVDTYREVLADADFPVTARTTVSTQLSKIESVLADMRKLESVA
ncbi:PA2169 family four-helix-bundle protein [Lewinella sp. 4G2]|uniref:ferritin-like domain-containing protein n=1 Tax=Lewinella sp. 4G2 TaxID=1803372 RepID=UPI0007E02499|nr:PA2169 family four-helix-bundle protein [Lewinella sp. 4G2]OAV45865.1 hypothetical protein A3850_009285 [Lewinella sp. 4G2]